MFKVKSILTAALLFVLITACEKEKDEDTPDNLTKTELLTRKPWITQETYILEANTLTKYERGASGNTGNFDNEVVTFNSNGSGTFKDIYGATNNFTWNWTNSQQTRLRLVITYPTFTNTIDYNMVEVTENSFTGSLHYIVPNNGNRVLASFKRIPQP